MSRLDDLPPDQRAVLSLLVRQGKSHAEIAELLGIPRQSVSDRANAALDTLADESSAPGDSTRRQPPRAGGAQPSAAGAPSAQPSAPRAGSASAPPGASSVGALKTQSSSLGSSASLPSSRRGGALLLAALVVIVVVVVILIASGGGSNKASSTQASSTTASTATHSTTPSGTKTSGASSTSTTSSTAKHGAKPTVDKQIALTSPEPGSKSIGLVEVVSEGSKHAIYIAAEHLPQPPSGSFYAVWLSNSPTSSTPLGRTPAVGANGRLQAGTLLPANAGDYQKILLTRETDTKAAQPGPTVLSGAFSLGH